MPNEEGIVGITCRMLLRLEQGIKVPEAALNIVVRRHFYLKNGLEWIQIDSNGFLLVACFYIGISGNGIQ
jgi:hypothetical protein